MSQGYALLSRSSDTNALSWDSHEDAAIDVRGADRIAGGWHPEAIILKDVSGTESLSITQGPDGAVVQFDGTEITLKGIQACELTLTISRLPTVQPETQASSILPFPA
jgi:hypothetical protein